MIGLRGRYETGNTAKGRRIMRDCENGTGAWEGEKRAHEWGPVELARLTGNPHRKCLYCAAVTLDLSDDDGDGA